MVFVIAACVFGAAVYSLRKGHLLWGLFLGLSGAYELCGPILASGIFGDEVVAAQSDLAGVTGEQTMRTFVVALSVFFLIAHVVYHVAFRALRLQNLEEARASRNFVEGNHFLLLFILVCGLISNYYKAGATRLQDYGIEGLNGGLPTTPAFSYGALMLVVLAIAFFSGILHRRRTFAALCLVGATPLMVELFISSRRQYFAPSVAAVLLIIYYTKEIKHKWLWVGTIASGALVFLGAQFWVRNAFLEGSSASGVFQQSIAPQLGEFVAIGTTSVTAWDRFVMGNLPISHGLHLAYNALNSVPFLHPGVLLWPAYGDQLGETARILAPWGGLSVLAEALWAFGILGIPILAVLAGILLAFAQRKLNQFVAREALFSLPSVYLISLVATLMLKYRSGISDMLQSTINFSLLYLFVAIGQSFIQGFLNRTTRQAA